MKNKGIFIATFIFFLLVNTTQLWEGKMGMFAMMTFLIMIIFFLVLSAILIGQLFKLVKEEFRLPSRLLLIGFMTIVLTTSFLFPHGLINYELVESESLFVAQREGAANCMTTLKLKANNKFIERNVCFGVTETTGGYRISGDTIYFENDSSGIQASKLYQFAIIKNVSSVNNEFGDLVRYENETDSIGTELWITKNEL